MGDLRPGAPVALGYEAVPDGRVGPGVLVLHAWWGLNDFFRGLCDSLAEAGFVAVAPDLWGGAVATTADEAESLLDQRDTAAMGVAIAGAIDRLREHPAVGGRPVGAVGFSMGAAWAIYFSTERPDDIRAVTIFYGSGDVESGFARARAAYQGHFAEGDPWEPDAYVSLMEAAIRDAGRPVTFYRYPGTGHWFFEADRLDVYNPEAAALSWERSLAFLRKELGTP